MASGQGLAKKSIHFFGVDRCWSCWPQPSPTHSSSFNPSYKACGKKGFHASVSGPKGRSESEGVDVETTNCTTCFLGQNSHQKWKDGLFKAKQTWPIWFRMTCCPIPIDVLGLRGLWVETIHVQTCMTKNKWLLEMVLEPANMEVISISILFSSLWVHTFEMKSLPYLGCFLR